jgi:hypothetical protein
MRSNAISIITAARLMGKPLGGSSILSQPTNPMVQ